jgi:hypothetical protein
MPSIFPSATTSSALQRIDVSFPAAGDATGIYISMALDECNAFAIADVVPAATTSAQMRRATAITFLIPGTPISGIA